MRTRFMAKEEAASRGKKRRKVEDGEMKLPTSSTLIQFAKEDDYVPISCCSSNVLTKELHLKESVEPRTHSISKHRSKIKTKSGLPNTITAKASSVIRPTKKHPPVTELEEFFAAAEKQLHKHFKEKYNYDIVKDTPLEGRFEWVQMKL